MDPDASSRAGRADRTRRPRGRAWPAWAGPAAITLALWALTIPAIDAERWAASAAVAIALGIAGGLAVVRPVAAAVLAGLALTLPLAVLTPHVGLAIFVSPISLTACAVRGRLRAALGLGAWHGAVLTLASVLDGRTGGEVLVDAATWLFLIGLAIAVGTWIRRLVDRIGAERERRVLELADQRRALARELHDTAVRATTEIVLFAENAARRDGADPASVREFARISRTARLATDDLRALMEHLRAAEESGAPLDEGLLRVSTWRDVLDSTADHLTSAGFDVRISSEGEEALPARAVAVLGRCLEEIRANVVRHGDRGVSVAIMCETPEGVDAGVGPEGDLLIDLAVLNGIAPADLTGLRGGAGLQGARERLAELGGALEAHAEGTMFLTRITIPRRTETS